MFRHDLQKSCPGKFQGNTLGRALHSKSAVCWWLRDFLLIA